MINALEERQSRARWRRSRMEASSGLRFWPAWASLEGWLLSKDLTGNRWEFCQASEGRALQARPQERRPGASEEQPGAWVAVAAWVGWWRESFLSLWCPWSASPRILIKEKLQAAPWKEGMAAGNLILNLRVDGKCGVLFRILVKNQYKYKNILKIIEFKICIYYYYHSLGVVASPPPRRPGRAQAWAQGLSKDRGCLWQANPGQETMTNILSLTNLYPAPGSVFSTSPSTFGLPLSPLPRPGLARVLRRRLSQNPSSSRSDHSWHQIRLFIVRHPRLMSDHPDLPSASILSVTQNPAFPGPFLRVLSTRGPPPCSLAVGSHFSLLWSWLSPISLPCCKTPLQEGDPSTPMALPRKKSAVPFSNECLNNCFFTMSQNGREAPEADQMLEQKDT